MIRMGIMSLEENKTTVRKLFEAFNKRNLDELDELMAPDFVDHLLELRGLEANKQAFTLTLKGFPDWHETIEDIVAEGDKVVVRFKATGTHTGEFFGLSPTGRKVTFASIQIYRIVNGKVAECQTVSDSLGFLGQLGAIEYTEKAKKLFPQTSS